MSPFYTCALDNHLSGSLAYLESVRRIFVQDESTGLIEVRDPNDREVVLLYQGGRAFAAYRFEKEDEHAFACDPAVAEETWRDLQPDTELSIRYLNLPAQALRAAWQALDWGGPVRGAQMECRALPGYLDALGVERAQVLLRVILPGQDGFMLLSDGALSSAESVFATPRGFIESLPNLRGDADLGRRSCQARLYEIDRGTLSADVLDLRLACAQWVGGGVSNYQQLVGHNLVNALDYAMNTALRLNRWNLHLVGAALIDHELFLKPEEAARAYRFLIESMVENMAQVIGDSLARRALVSVYHKLKPHAQQPLQANGLAPAAMGME